MEATATVPRMRTIKETAQETGLSYDSIRKKCLNGEIVYIKNGNRFMINLDKFVEYLKTGTPWE